MKIFVLCIFFTIFRAGTSESFKDQVLKAQDELSWTHLFTEMQFISHRDMINPILEDIQKFSIDLYLDSIDTIKEVAANTRVQMDGYGNSSCAIASRTQFDQQVISHVNTLNYCASEATRILNGEYSDLTYFDEDGQRVAKHVQNQGFNILAQNSIFDLGGDYYTTVNARLRDLLLRAGPWIAIMDELLELMDHHTEQARYGVSMCLVIYTQMFEGIAADALTGIQTC